MRIVKMNYNNCAKLNLVLINIKFILCFCYLISVIVSCAEKSKFPKVDFIINPDDEKIILSNGELIVLVFSANDCSMCVDNIVTLLNDINDNSNENIKIIGILNTKYRQALDKVRYNY